MSFFKPLKLPPFSPLLLSILPISPQLFRVVCPPVSQEPVTALIPKYLKRAVQIASIMSVSLSKNAL